jgi:hypothetical protein
MKCNVLLTILILHFKKACTLPLVIHSETDIVFINWYQSTDLKANQSLNQNLSFQKTFLDDLYGDLLYLILQLDGICISLWHKKRNIRNCYNNYLIIL